MRRLFDLTWVGWLNVLVLQWLFLRLLRDVDPMPGEQQGEYSGEIVNWQLRAMPFGKHWTLGGVPIAALVLEAIALGVLIGRWL